jgi:transcriptional regulator with XRE-family HTH domain
MPITELHSQPSIGDNLRVLRVMRRLSQKELGKRVGLPQSRIWQYENNYVAPPDDELAKIVKALSTG